MTTYQAMARAHTNIALIKYWGKADNQLFIPMNSSLSLTLEALYTDTKVCFSD
ncbi:diphosphomevalonate decarboxylase, partial [Aerococcus urinae]|nr:diphosphomevalonate decarboxylase [Aerococcus urinae]